MEVVQALATLAILAMIITIVTDNIANLVKPIADVTKYKLWIALVWTAFGVIGLNTGALETLEMINPEVAMPWIHYFDLALTIALFCVGAQVVHKLADMIADYFKKEK